MLEALLAAGAQGLLAEALLMVRDPDLVRRAALVLASDRPLRTLFDELSTMLAAYVDASIVLIFVKRDNALACTYAYFQGRSGEPDDSSVSAESTAAEVLETGHAVRYNSEADWPIQRLVSLRGRIGRPQAAIFVPVFFGGERIGVLSVQSATANAYTESDVATLETCALFLGARINDEFRRETIERYERLATVDVLTGVANRSALDRTLEREWSRARRTGSSVAMVMLDVDFFKTYNDTYGHVAGDRCLQQIAAAAESCLERATDVFARYGGEEFAAILPDVDLEGAVKVAESIHDAVEALALPHEGSTLGFVSISAGCAAAVPHEGYEAISLVLDADRALYAAKQTGRNRVVAEGIGAKDVPAARRSQRRGSLPLRRSRFIGRAADIARLGSALLEHPLVTIVGPGGVGKTRTAVEVAQSFEARFPEGCWFVDLKTLGDPAELVGFVAAALKGLVPAAASASELAASLRDVRALVILDNCEHLVEAAASFTDELLTSAPELRMLATSREPLGIDGETVYRIKTLELEDGIELFLDRVRNAGVAEPDKRDPCVADIVRQLDGIPLAIELAAPQLATMTLEELRDQVGDRMTHVRTRGLRRPTRQQTLRALMEWGYRLLTPQEQAVFRRLAVFPGGWTYATAGAVCRDDRLSPEAVTEIIERLVAKSLVEMDADDEGAGRFSMLETTREYAADVLELSGEAVETVRRHADTFVEFALAAGSQRLRTPSTVWQRHVTQERENIMAAFVTLLEDGNYDTAARAFVGVCGWLLERGAISTLDLLPYLESALGGDRPLEPQTRAVFCLALASMRLRVGARRSLELARTAYEYFRDTDDVLAAQALRCSAQAELSASGLIDAGLAAPIEALVDRMERQGELQIAAELVNLLGTLYTQLMDDAALPKALACFDRGVGLYEVLGDADRCGTMIGNSGDVAFYMGDVIEAATRAQRALTLFAHSQEPWQAAIQYLNLGHFASWSHDFETARYALRKALADLTAYFGIEGEASVFDKYARLAFVTAKDAAAARMLGYADACYTRSGSSRQRREDALVEDMRRELRDRLGLEAFTTEYELGRRWTPSQAERETEAV